ncbi:glycosyltransferase family 4 protein [Sphaerisporangium sp. NPDC005288]|uniref:glycosyltransferase family 4 protein n=1 Tax=Sphaerisporangium sp. NPDC005288 TaxID=3155114 RepID=UPI0033B93890
MRIVHVGYRLPPEPGGLERHIERLAREQLARGHRVVVAHRRGRAPEGAQTLTLRRTRRSRLLARRSDVLAFGLECARALRDAGEVDVVHVHGDHRETLALGPAARRLGVPLVVTVHGAMTMRHLPIMPFAFRHVDDFIAIGARPAQDLRGAGVPASRIATMSSGLDLRHIARHHGEPVEPGLIVSVGSLEKVKNHAVTIEAFHALRALHPGARLVIAGEGSERAALQQLAGTGRGVHLAGHLPESEVYALVARAQAFVLASRRLPTIGEGIPTAALEALALGTPVILSSETSLEPIVEAGAYRTFLSGSVPDLVRRLREVLEGDRALPEIIERGLRAAATLDWSSVAARVEERYTALLPGGPLLPATAS